MTHGEISRRAFALGAVCVGCLPSTKVAAQVAALKVRLDWTPWGVHGAVHLAQTKGWLEAAGLNVLLQDGSGSASTVQLLGSGGEFDVGHASLATMMVARSKGLAVKAFAIFFRQGDIGLFVPKGSGIKAPGDLRNRKVIYTAGSLEAPFIDTFLAAGKLNRNEVELVAVSAASKVAAYVAGQADAAFSTIPFFVPAVATARPSDAIRFADYNLHMPGYGFLAQEGTLHGPKREAIARFASIISATWSYIYDGHQDEAVDAIVSQRPQARLDRKVLRAQIDSLQGFVESPAAREKQPGEIVATDWDIAVETLSAVGLLDPTARGEQFIETGLVSPIDLAVLRR
ncbi:ABC transporter substrate-binding protein [Tardiphaga sp. 866_E4_N2_1]|uniref:ABC transporter substrate-binding protein n=1 Tax=unclassified Tardiphaga TaxID=2631404 RepID=UPI003F26B1AE